MDDQKKLLTMIELKKPVEDVTEEELDELARHVVRQVRRQIPSPKPTS